jgi:formamidopyrimidine-DNA glycosylase
MPELPEIETVKLQLSKVLPGKTIERIEVLKPKSFIGDKSVAEGKKVVKIERMAKLLLIDLTGDISLAIHFKMTGQLIWIPKTHNSQLTTQERIVGGHPTKDFTGELPSKHTRVIFHLSDKSTLYFNDQRIFGWVKAGLKKDINDMDFIKGLGPEPFEMTEDEFLRSFGLIKRPIKIALMDQEKISGVGNIYANDALWEAGIKPQTPSNKITKEKLKLLFEKVKLVLKEGIIYGGATASDAKYIDLNGMGGHYQEHFRVYDRKGLPCLRNDGGVVEKFAMGGRGTYFCPVCQK